MSLIDDDIHVINDIIQTNGIHTLLDTLIVYFQDIDGIECSFNNKRQLLSMAVNNRFKILKAFSIHNERMKTPLIKNV